MRNIIYLATYELDFPLSIVFTYENAHVFSIDNLTQLDICLGKGAEDENEIGNNGPLGYLAVEILSEINDFESANDAAAHARPKLLVILSLISLFCDKPFAPYMSASGSTKLGNKFGKEGETRFIIGENQQDWTSACSSYYCRYHHRSAP